MKCHGLVTAEDSRTLKVHIMARSAGIWVILVTAVFAGIEGQRMFTNPIFDFRSADPAVLLHEGYYYLPISTNAERELTLYKSRRLSNFRDAESKVVYRANEGENDIWASEIHEVDGEIYIYFTMRRADHRMYAMKADDPSNPFGEWGPLVPMQEGWDDAGIDLTVLKHGNGQKYFMWVNNGALFLAKMINATMAHPSHLRLRKDTLPWECCQNEGPYFFYNNGTTYLLFSGGDTGNPNYAMGLMSIEGHKDPMNPSNWEWGDGPVFWRNDEEDVYGPGHGSVTTSPDGTEVWLMYHGAFTPVFTERIARIDQITFDSNGKPVFPRPSGANHVLNVPSGEV